MGGNSSTEEDVVLLDTSRFSKNVDCSLLPSFDLIGDLEFRSSDSEPGDDFSDGDDDLLPGPPIELCSLSAAALLSSISFAEDELILGHDAHKLHHPRGIQKRMLWHCTLMFFVRGIVEMYNFQYTDFTLGENECGPFVKYIERNSKNYTITFNQCQEEDFQTPAICYDDDVV